MRPRPRSAEPPPPPAVRTAYERLGVEPFYRAQGENYRNPHETALRELLTLAWEAWPLPRSEVLDLACGSGEVTLALETLGVREIAGADPHTGEAYRERTGREALNWSFEQLALGFPVGKTYRLIVCSFALHLVVPSRLPRLCHELAGGAPELLIVTPHKRPHILPEWGWNWEKELVHRRIRARYYRRNRP